MTPRVTAAMERRDAAKDVIRGWWMDEVADHLPRRTEKIPVYLTLPGAHGLDIAAMAERGLIERTETGAIADPEDLRVVAVEANSDAASNLQSKFPGLQIVQKRMENLLRGESTIRFPDRTEIDICRAHVINFDANGAVEFVESGDAIAVRPLVVVRKFAQIQLANPHPGGWTLCVTLHAEMVVDASAAQRVAEFLSRKIESNRETCGSFDESYGDLVGEDLTDAEQLRPLVTPRGDTADASTEDARKRFLLVAVGKMIVDEVAGLGAQVTVTRAAHYGGSGVAPMLTWVMRVETGGPDGAATRICAGLDSLGTGIAAGQSAIDESPA